MNTHSTGLRSLTAALAAAAFAASCGSGDGDNGSGAGGIPAGAAVLQINEVAPNVAGSHDFVELVAVGAGTTRNTVLLQNPATGGAGTITLATFPDAQVVVGDIIVVHVNAAAGVTGETSAKNACSDAACFATAWDFVGGSTGITFTNTVLSVRTSNGTTMDAVAFAQPGLGSSPVTFPEKLQFIQALGQWSPANSGGQPSDYTTVPSAVDVSVDWSAVGTTAGGSTVQRTGTSDTNTNADWTVKASTLGLAN